MVLALVASLLAAPAPDPSPDSDDAAFPFSFGIGYVVTEQRRSVDALDASPTVADAPTSPTTSAPEDSTEAPASQAAPQPASLAPRLPPPRSDLARIQGSPRARGLSAAAAIATQMAMIIAGIAVVREQREQAREARRGQAPPYRPYR